MSKREGEVEEKRESGREEGKTLPVAVNCLPESPLTLSMK